MFRMSFNVLLIIFLATQASCVLKQAKVNFSEFADFKIQNESFDGKALGFVRGDAGGAIWNDCQERVKMSVREMIDQAKELGANVIGDIKWPASEDTTPTCKKAWGWVLLPPFLFTPVFMSSSVTGTAYKLDNLGHNMYFIPKSSEKIEDLVKEIVATR